MENSAIHDSQNHQKVKKKAKNKKHPQTSVVVQNNGNAADSAVTEIATKNCKPPSTLDNCLSEKLQESLHISTKKSKSNRCNNKINGIVGILVTENGADEATATTKTTTTMTMTTTTDINGHSVESQINHSISAMNGCASSIEDLDNDQRPNGHCSDATINLTSKNISSNNCHSDESICETSLSEQSSNEKTNSFSNKFSETKTFKNIVSADPAQDSMPSIVESLPLTQLPSPATTICGVEAAAIKLPQSDLSKVHIEYKQYESELQMHDIMRLIQAELSEPYSIYTYRYFIYNWPKLCFLAAHGNVYVGAIVCKLDMHQQVRRGYIAMLAVHKDYRNLKIGTTLVQKAIEAMLADNAEEVVLETEMQNMPALRLYENLGFVRDKRLFRYYLNGVDALRLKLWFR